MRASAFRAAPALAVPDWARPVGWGLVFVVTGLVGVWAAYDRSAAWYRFGLILVGTLFALCIAWIGHEAGEPGLAVVGLGCALLAAALAAYFLLSFDWQARGVVKVPVLYQAGLWLQGHRPAVPVPEDIHTNVAGGALVLLLPMAGGAIAWAWRRWPWPVVLLACAALALGLVGLLLAVSRGAWLGLAAGAVLAVYLAVRSRGWQARGKRTSRWRAAEYGLLAVLVLLVAAIPYLALTGKVTMAPLFDASISSRPDLWRWGLDLVSDYPFTGSGLGSTMMVQATYVMMLHVGFISHMHNLLLQIAVEQGIPGLIAFVALVVLAIASLVQAYRAGRVTPLFGGAVAALTALLVHGAVDAGVYVALTVPLMFLPIGFALGVAPARGAGRSLAPEILSSAVVALALVMLLLSPVRAAFLANLGAVAQTRAELSRYTWPDVPIQDALRRSPDVDLRPAIDYYRAALALHPANATANRRLGQIEMSRGEYNAAREHLGAAYRAAPGQQASRFLLGESLAIGGQVEEAAVLWRNMGENSWWSESGIGQQVVNVRSYWYDSLGERQRAEDLIEAVALAGRR